MLAEAFISKAKTFIQYKSIRHTAVLFSGRAAVQLVALLSQSVLARLYTPAQFGEFAFMNSVMAILLVASSGMYEIGIVHTRREQQARRLFKFVQLLLAGYVLTLVLLVVLLPSSLQNWFATQGLSPAYLWLLPVLVLFAGYWQIVYNWLVRFQQYYKISLALFLQRLLIMGASLSAILFTIPGNGLIFGLIVGYLGIFIVSLCFQKESPTILYSTLKPYAAHFRQFPLYSVPSLCILLLIQHLPVLWIIHFFEKSTTGAYSIAITIVMLPVTYLMMSAGQVYYQRIAQASIQQQPAIVRNYLSAFVSILLPTSLILFLCGEPLTVLLFGKGWQEAGYIVTLLAPLGLFQGISSLLTIPLNSFRKQAVNLLLQILKLILFGISLVIGIFYQEVYLLFKLISLASFIHLCVVAAVMYFIMRLKYIGEPAIAISAKEADARTSCG